MKNSKNILIINLIIIIGVTVLLMCTLYFNSAKFTDFVSGKGSFFTGKQILETRCRKL